MSTCPLCSGNGGPCVVIGCIANIIGALVVVTVLGFALLGCHVKPLPVPHPEYWSPEYGATDYPALGGARDAGRD